MSTPAGITVLGSTGSIGVSTLDVVARHPDKFRVEALTASTSDARLAEQCLRFRPRFAAMVDPDAAQRLADRLKQAAPEVQVLHGTDGLVRLAGLDGVDYVMAAIVGAAGLLHRR